MDGYWMCIFACKTWEFLGTKMQILCERVQSNINNKNLQEALEPLTEQVVKYF
jgi:hypothetical protein